MKRLFSNYSLPKNLDILFFLVFGILLQMTDGSPLTLKERWVAVWDTELPVELFSQFVQRVIKTVLSMIVVVRCIMSFAYVVSAILVIFCLLKDSAPKLILPWLLVAGIKSVLITFVEALAGVYVCSAFGHIRKACIEFVVSKAVEITYLWGSILNIYQDMERVAEENKKPEILEQLFIQRGELGRPRARSLLDESTLYKTSCLNNFEFKDVPHIILQMLRRGNEMSDDSLLDPGMMLASVSNMGSFDNLKTSQSLGELGFVDLRCAQVIGLEEDESLSPQDKALKFLKLTWSDVRRAQRNKTVLGSDIHRIDTDTWRQVVNNGTHINKPNRARAEVYIREIQQIEPEEDPRKSRKRSFDLKFSWSFFNLYAAKQTLPPEMDDEQESLVFREDEDEDEEGREDEEPTPLFMSNIREEVVVDRIRLDFVTKKMKGNSYAQLYKQDYMSVIGPEVFEKATKLKKVTSLSRLKKGTETVTSMSYPTISFTGTGSNKKILLDHSSHDNFNETSYWELKAESRDLKSPTEPDWVSKAEFVGVASTIGHTDLAEDKTLVKDRLGLKFDRTSTQSEEAYETLELESKDRLSCDSEKSETATPSKSEESTDNAEETPPCYRKRRIRIRLIGKQKSDSVADLSSNSESFCETPSRTSTLRWENPKGEEPDNLASGSTEKASLRGSKGEFSTGGNRQIYFLKNMIQHRVLNVLSDLEKSTHKLERMNSGVWKGKGKSEWRGCEGKLCGGRTRSQECQEEQEQMNWKSEVLKTVEAYRGKKSEESFFNFTEKCVSRRLLEYCIRKNYQLETQKNILLSLCTANGLCKTESNENVCAAVSPKENDVPEKGSLNEVDSESSPCRSAGQVSNPDDSESQQIDFICRKISKVDPENELQVSNPEILRSDTDFEKLKTKEDLSPAESQQRLDSMSDSEVFSIHPDEEPICSQESDEPISLYYSQAANLASPLLDVKRFIYPDHIHYSYKHVKKKGFDVDISGGLPLLMRESLSMSTPMTDSMSAHPELAITRRPMDLSFATTNAFTEWQTNDQTDVDPVKKTKKTKSHPKIGISSNRKEQKSSNPDASRSKKGKTKNNNSNTSLKPEPSQGQNLKDFRHFCTSKDYHLIEKLLKMHLRFNGKESSELSNSESERAPVQISSTQLHSNKGRVNSTYNPALFLQENKTRAEKKKLESQEERTKDMFARLEREALLHSKNVQRSAGPFRQT